MSTLAPRVVTGGLTQARRTVADLVPLLRFRFSGMRRGGRRAAWLAGVVITVATLAAAVGPAFAPGANSKEGSGEVAILLPTAYLAFFIATVLAIVAAGGGRELLPRDQAVAYPISPATDHLGALVLTPLNVAWLVQAWSLLGATAYVVGPDRVWASQVSALAWIGTATAGAQAVAWLVEWVRRGRYGVLVLRAGLGMLSVLVAVLVVRDAIGAVFDNSPTLQVVFVVYYGASGTWGPWLTGTALLVLASVVLVVVGAGLAHLAAHRQPRDELRAEGRVVAARTHPPSELAALLRLDRASVWRSVPLRRGFVVLAVLPGLIAAAGQVSWHMLPVLPGLVAAGGALLFGVNAWCLDHTGALWRDSLPVRPDLVFAVRVLVLLEVLLVATTVTLLVAGLRADGTPTASELAALLCTIVVVSLQVLARSMHWSVHRPFPADLRSARGTPAPPLAMVGYSAYLAMTSTLTGMVFSATAGADDWHVSLLVALPLVLLALRRLVATAREWTYPVVRAHVITTVT